MTGRIKRVDDDETEARVGDAAPSVTTIAPPTTPPSTRTRIKVLMTNYWIVDLADPSTYSEYRLQDGEAPEKSVVIKEPGPDHIMWLNSRFLRAVKMEGTGRIPEGLLNYYSGDYHLTSDPHYPYPWGRGASGLAVVPFKTIAVDPAVFPLRSICRIEELVGFVMPSGEQHDGVVVAADTGGAIKGNHIDLYVGNKRDRVDARFKDVHITFPV